MRIVNRETHQAIRALLALAEDGREKTTVAELAERMDIPRPLLRKIVQILNQEGILESSRGKGGGFRLAMPAGQISLARLIQAFQKSFQLQVCLCRKKFCVGLKNCPLRRKIQKIEKAMLAELAATTIGALALEFAAAGVRNPNRRLE